MGVSVIGTGYVDLVTGGCLAHIGHDVMCVDNNFEKVEKAATLQAGQSPILVVPAPANYFSPPLNRCPAFAA